MCTRCRTWGSMWGVLLMNVERPTGGPVDGSGAALRELGWEDLILQFSGSV